MTLETTTNTAIEALAKNQLIHWGAGDAWESGCEVTLGTSTEDIVINVAGGSVYVGGTDNPVTVNAQSKILQAGHPDHPRKDVVYVDDQGSVDVVAGTAAPIKSDLSQSNPGFDPVYHAYRPAPDELDGEGGEKLALAVVWVPPDATASADLDKDITYVQDRRLKAPIGSGGIGGGGANVITTKSITHEGGVTSTVVTFTGISEDPTDAIFPLFRIDPNSAIPNGDWNVEYSVGWTGGTGWDISITLTWDDDPGAGNDLYLKCDICNGAPEVISTDFTDADAVEAVNADSDHGDDAPHNYFSGNPSDLNQEGATDGQHIEWDADTGQYVARDPASTGALNVIDSGAVALSSGAASVDTGIASSTTATFMVALGPDTDDAEVVAAVTATSGGNYTIDIEETADTNVGNPIVAYDLIRVR